MKPSQLSHHLRRIASAIDNSENPSRTLVARDLKDLIYKISSDERKEALGKLVLDMDFMYEPEKVKEMTRTLNISEDKESAFKNYKQQLMEFWKNSLDKYAMLWKTFSEKFPEDARAKMIAARAARDAKNKPQSWQKTLDTFKRYENLTDDDTEAFESMLHSLYEVAANYASDQISDSTNLEWTYDNYV